MLAAQLYHFLMDLHRHPATMGARLLFAFAGAAMFFQGFVMMFGCFQRPLPVQERAWWQRVYPPPLSKPFDYPVRAFYLLIGTLVVAIGLPLLFELFI
jgi:hypothetical protein